MLPLSILFDRLEKAPFNAAFFPDGVVLTKLAGCSRFGGAVPSEIGAVAAAEILVRFFLSRRPEYREALEDCFGGVTLDDFISFCDDYLSSQGCIAFQSIFRTLDASVKNPFLCRVLEIAKLRFEFLLHADGVIPVCFEDGGFFIPFKVGDLADGGWDDSVVCDLAGASIDAWTQAVRDLPGKGNRGLRIQCAVSRGSAADTRTVLVGRSLMLPVQMALWRRDGALPKYTPLRVLATGAFDVDGHLRSVETDAKVEAARRGVADMTFFHPVSGAAMSADGVVGIPVVTDAQSVLNDHLRPELETRFIHDAVYAIRRLDAQGLYAEVEMRRYGDWRRMADRLENLCKSVNRLENPDEYLCYMMLLGMANCHAGNTEEALKWNGKAVAFARRKGGDSRYGLQLARLGIDLLVCLTDREDFDAIVEQADVFEKGALGELEKGQERQAYYDTVMRFSGTMGQAYAYAALAGHAKGDSGKALSSFEKAYASAQELYRMACGRNEAEAAVRRGDMAHDANYLHLWSVLFEPEDAEESFSDAQAACHAIGDAGARRKNHVFLTRQRALHFYRRLLGGGTLPDDRDVRQFEDVFNDADAAFWLRALVGKYTGALLAATGRVVEARARFAAAVALVEKDYGDAVIQKIRMTICAEAYRSLREAAVFSGEAETFRSAALTYFDGDEDRSSADRGWLDFLQGEADFPGLFYWY